MPADQNYQTKSAVLFVIFNRPEVTGRVFEQIRAAKPGRLYVAADAPRNGNMEDAELCRQARAVIDTTDWDCELKTLFRTGHLGCRDGVSSAVTWFFGHEEEGIILEDDCLPAGSFFRFCDTMLQKYRDDTRIRHITGFNPHPGKKWGSGSYYFSNMTHVWGWASWKRVWNDYDKNLGKYDGDEISGQLKNIFSDPVIVASWERIFRDVKAGKINAWGYQLDFANFFNNGLTIIPNENLISNIGFGPDATHTVDEHSLYANMPLAEIHEIVDPIFIVPEKEADRIVLTRDLKVDGKRHKQKRMMEKVRSWSRSVVRQAASFIFFT